MLLSSLLTGSRLAPEAPGATILVYHNVSPITDKAALLSDSVTVQDFEFQIQYLREHGFRVIPLQELVSQVVAGGQPSSNTIVITFDDGYKGVFLYAFPILKAYDMRATVFLAAEYMGRLESFPWLTPGAGPSSSEDRRPLSWEEVLLLDEGGMEIGSHSFSHRFLPLLSKEDIRDEVLRSQAVIAAKTGIVPRSFALPFSFPVNHRAWPLFAEALTAALEEGCYHSCCTMTRGHVAKNSNQLLLHRMAIIKHDSLYSFRTKLTGGYVWTCLLQAFHQHTFKRYSIYPE